MYVNTFPVIDLVATGDNIRRLRLERGMTVRDLQDYFGFEEPRAIYKWQKGESLPTVDNLYALGNLLEVPMEQILGNRQISRRIKKHLWLSNRSWARDVHSFGILHSWGALAGKSCSAQASSIWLIAGAFRRTQSK